MIPNFFWPPARHLPLCAGQHVHAYACADNDNDEGDNVGVVVSGLGYGNAALLVQEASANPMGLLDKFLKKNGADTRNLMDHMRYPKPAAGEEPNCAVSWREGPLAVFSQTCSA